jgi:hypothetical protein
VMVITAAGKLTPSTGEYDTCVAGIVSGAGGITPGVVLNKQTGSNRAPIALCGRVYCKVDASTGAVHVGDLLTTSATAGHAMKVMDPALAFGAVLGKSLGTLKSGTGLVPILVALQ